MRKVLEKQGHELAEARSSIAAAIGTGTHALVAELFKQKMSYGQMDVADALAVRDAKFVEEIEKGIIWDETTKHIDVARAQLEALGRAFLPVAELTDPINVEDELSFFYSPLGEQAIPIKLIGHRDVRDRRNEIHDHKTGNSFPACHAQLGGYAMLSMSNDQEVSAVRVNYAPRLPMSRLHECKVRSVRLDLDVCMQAAWTTMREIQLQYERFLETGDSWSIPANAYSQSCTPKYCSAFCTSWCQEGISE